MSNTNMYVEIEEYFIDNWTITPIQFSGTDFEQPRKWISLEYIPIDRTSNTCNRKLINSQLKIRCYDISPTLSMNLSDQVYQFFDCIQLLSSYSSTGTSDGLGVINLGNNVFESTIIFEINNLV